MKITEHTPIRVKKSKLAAFSQKQFTLELDGFQLLALYYVSRKIGGWGKTRRAFSSDSANKENFIAIISEIDGVNEAMQEFYCSVQTDPNHDTICISDKLE